MPRRLLILRPEPGASATADRARSMGLDPLVAPLFRVEALDWHPPDPGRYDAAMITSASAARLAGDALRAYRHLPLYAVGPASARAAREAGFLDVRAGDADGAALIAQAAGDGVRHLVHFAGFDHVPLVPRGLRLDRLFVYRAVDNPPTPALLSALNDGPVVAMLHSARAARRFAALVPDRRSIALAAISAAVADVAGIGWRALRIAERPADASLLAASARLCEEDGRQDGRTRIE